MSNREFYSVMGLVAVTMLHFPYAFYMIVGDAAAYQVWMFRFNVLILIIGWVEAVSLMRTRFG